MYNTKQKQALTEFFMQNNNRQYSAKEIAENMCAYAKIGKSTVYRLIDKMVSDGTLRRFRGADAKSVVYQYTGQNHECDSHFHLKCVNCGTLIHLECDSVSVLNQHIFTHHGFEVDPVKTVFYGLCKTCGREK